MNRREFLAILGFGVASIFGLSTLLRMFGHEHPLRGKGSNYGTSSYGGL